MRTWRTLFLLTLLAVFPPHRAVSPGVIRLQTD
ncbi:unnamed protein product [Leptidea sinapis]|uniref:Uncharacterized protein n=1 Tax=Leptidea sinapis TaxID=189913 RepID=A0A5E4PNF2_9NEOP|nr:unnamed protein product [Leptidea sinapis]